VIRAAGAGTLDGEWTTEDGRFAQMLLCDQLSRGAFRGTAEAFAFDDRAIELFRSVSSLAWRYTPPSSARVTTGSAVCVNAGCSAAELRVATPSGGVPRAPAPLS
jgi:hypothetical protein